MFLEKTTNKIKGYIKIKVCGFFIERFMNLALKDNVKLWNINRNDDSEVVAFANIFEYKKLVEIAKKTGCRINIEEKVGVPFFIMKHKKRKPFVIVFILIVICIYVYGLHIWDVDIVGDFTFDIEDIKNELEIENVKIGALKKNLDISRIKNNIYMRRYDIAWIGINLKGTKAIIEVVEGKLKEIDEMDNVPCDIISTKEGMVCKVNALEGRAMVMSGDMVKSGDVLISGIISSDWSEDRYVSSKGSVFIKTWYTNVVKIPFERDIVSKTGRKEKKYILGIKNYEINLTNSDTKFEKYDTIISSNNLLLFGKIELPIKLTEIVYQEVDVDTVKYTKEQAILSAKNEIENNVIKKLEGIGEVIDTEIKTEENEDGIKVVITIECIEETGTKQRLNVF